MDRHSEGIAMALGDIFTCGTWLAVTGRGSGYDVGKVSRWRTAVM